MSIGSVAGYNSSTFHYNKATGRLSGSDDNKEFIDYVNGDSKSKNLEHLNGYDRAMKGMIKDRLKIMEQLYGADMTISDDTEITTEVLGAGSIRMSVGDKSLTLAPVPYYDMSEADEIGKSVLSGESIPKSVYDKAMKRWEEELERPLNIDTGSFFDSKTMGNSPGKLPSFVEKVFTEEELQQYVDNTVKSNQDKKISFFDLLKKTTPGWSNAGFKFAGEDKTYNIYEFMDEFEKRSEGGKK